MSDRELILVSACLAGLKTRYDGCASEPGQALPRLETCRWIPVCPEQLGGLPTPRCPADIIGGDGSDVLDGQARVVCRDGSEVTEAFVRGAEMVLQIARSQRIGRALLKARSPSCGVHRLGVTAALLRRHGLEIEEGG